MITFGERLQELRKNKSLTQKQMAELLGMTERGFRAYENNQSTPHYDTLVKLADYFNVSLDYLTGRADEGYLMPSFLFQSKEYKALSDKAKLTYMMILESYEADGITLSEKLKDNKKASSEYLTQEVKSMLDLSDEAALKVINELVKFDLLEIN